MRDDLEELIIRGDGKRGWKEGDGKRFCKKGWKQFEEWLVKFLAH
jgi:hypothetical protein